MTDEMARRAEEIAGSWHFLYRMDMRCVARSDNGIDYDGEYRRRTMRIAPEMVVFENGEPTGISFADHLFLFSDPETQTLTASRAEGYVGGWGDVTEKHYYQLMPGPAPEDSHPAVPQH